MSGKWIPKLSRRNSMPSNYKSKEELEEEEDVVKITDKLFLSGQVGTNAIEHLSSLGITHILTLGREGPLSPSPDHFVYGCIGKEDLCYEDLLSSFWEAIDFIKLADKCLIHCHKGVSRSPSIIVAYLMAMQNLSLDSALALVRQRRPVVSPNYGFLRQLRLFQAMDCQLSGPLYRWYLKEVAGCQSIHPDVFTENPGMSVDPAVYLTAVEEDSASDNDGFHSDTVYGCRKCHRVLFTPVHVLSVDVPHISVEKIQWMKSRNNDESLCCPNGHFLGSLRSDHALVELETLVALHLVIDKADVNGVC
eukprot:GGOE01000869.1.p1 GENE.GGOE01000869.1~~GGOE01000869.1.p1  ORF type:complete len:306 (+),score=14.10 GGOE01000869.1:60-977(+)